MTPKHVEVFANLLIAIKADSSTTPTTPPQVGIHWTKQWIARHPQYFKRNTKPLDLNRQLAHDPANIQRWFNGLRSIMTSEGIVGGDIYNHDESGFMIGWGRDQYNLTKHARRRRFLPSAQNREMVTVAEAMCGDRSVLPPMIILPGQLHLERWLNNELDGDTLTAVSDTRYINDEIALSWLEQFDKCSAMKQVGRKGLLLMDNHISHQTFEFLKYAREKGILLYYLPPHATHFLQPLDVVIFQPYKHWHAEAVDAATRTGCYNITKVDFLASLQSIRRQIFEKNTVRSAFRKTRIIPWNPGPIIDYGRELAVQYRTPSPQLCLLLEQRRRLLRM